MKYMYSCLSVLRLLAGRRRVEVSWVKVGEGEGRKNGTGRRVEIAVPSMRPSRRSC